MMTVEESWGLRTGRSEAGHPTVTEFTTGIVGCGDSWCHGQCGLPAFVLQTSYGKELRAFGSMVAFGPVFQDFRISWTGSKVAVTLGSTSEAEALKRVWW